MTQELQTQAIDTLELHEKQIINQCRIQAQSIVETGKVLKAIKDGKEYTAKGFDSFTAYMDDACSSIFPFRNGQAYKYIRVYEAYGPRLEQYGTMSLDVLDMFRDVAPDEFEEVAKELEGMSVKEAEELKKKLEAANQQISFLTEQVDKAKEETKETEQEYNAAVDESTKYEAEVERLKKEISDLASKPIDVAVAEPSQEQLDKIKADIESKYIAETENIKSGYEQKLEKLNKKLDKEKAVADEKAKEFEKKLQQAGKADEELIEFKFYFTSVQENLKKFLEVLGKIEDPEKKAKYKDAAKQFMDAIMADIKEA